MSLDIHALFKNLSKQQTLQRVSTADQRIALLKRLKSVIKSHEDRIYEALKSDLGKSHFESAVTEVLFTYAELDYAVKHLRSWMRPKRISGTLSAPFAKNRLQYESKGVSLVIAPWNYPFQLVMSPLISAIAAGNCVVVKPSEISSKTAAVISAILSEAFKIEVVACVEGGKEIAEELLDLPFNHIFFTGSTETGQKIMLAAGKHLASVTLELGGKSPVIIGKDADLFKAAEKIAWGKLVNAGQTCIAPDHLYVPHNMKERFLELYELAVARFFPDFEERNKDYGKIINEKHFFRLKGLIEDAKNKGINIIGGQSDAASLRISPTVAIDANSGLQMMKEEIFGPILPVISYTDIEAVIADINQREKPLALYIFSQHKSFISNILSRISSGGACINDVLVHISNPKLPFGGVNGSGQGSCHGFFGFKSFSHERAIVYQSAWNFTSIIYPPYAGKQWVLKLLKKIM